ncbi:hypothetical protein HUJ04_010657 [Dendroctonus ponderosae]|nr:hypothetical protein HUJ04_010657 [Dendroctonus ponderosae]
MSSLGAKELNEETTSTYLYAPTEAKDDVIKDSFYDLLERTVGSLPIQDMLVLCGDFDAQISKSPTLRPTIIGPIVFKFALKFE